MYLVAGYPGVGKSTVAFRMSSMTGLPVLDKATMTEPLMNAIHRDLRSSHSIEDVLSEFMEPQYDCLLNTAFELVSCGIRPILVAPFINQLSDPDWVARVESKCYVYGTPLRVLLVTCPTEIHYQRMKHRNSPRDTDKLSNWSGWSSTIDPESIMHQASMILDSSQDTDSQLQTFLSVR